MRLVLLFALATLVALALQTSLPRVLPVGMLVPDLVVILVVDLALRHPGVLAVAMAFAMGYATDAFSGNQLGLNAFLLTLVFLLAYWLSRVLISNSTAIGVLAVFASVIFCDVGNYLISSRFVLSEGLYELMPPVLIQSSITALLTPWVFAMMGGAARLVGLRPSSTGR